MPRPNVSPLDRVLRRVTFESCPVAGLEGDCWIFAGAKRKGYGTISVGSGSAKRARYTHQVTYEGFIGPRPQGEPDHLCKVKACCNPWHLRYGTHRDNMRTAYGGTLTHCIRGHNRHEAGQAKGRGCAECAREDHRVYMKTYPSKRGPRT